MNFKTNLKIALICFPAFFFKCTNKDIKNDLNELETLSSFANLYGDIRYFYPSDEAQQIDWDLFAIYGIDKVRKAKTEKELQGILTSLFQPIVPELSIGSDDKIITSSLPKKSFHNTVYWQYEGYSDDNSNEVYKKSRVNSVNPISFDRKFSNESFALGNSFKIDDSIKIELNSKHEILNWKTKTLYFLGYKNDITENWSYKFLGSNESDGNKKLSKAFLFQNKPLQLKLVIRLLNKGKVITDNVKISLKKNGKWGLMHYEDFHNADSLLNKSEFYYSYISKDKENFVVEALDKSVPQTQLFDSSLSSGDEFINQVNKSFSYQFPLLLTSDSLGTNPNPGNRFKKTLDELRDFSSDKTNLTGENLALANVIIAWNVFKHFNPYLDQSNNYWNQVLNVSFKGILSENKSNLNVLKQMVHKINDGHGEVKSDKSQTSLSIPIYIEQINKKFVVTKTTGGSLDTLLGRQLIEINTVSVSEYIDSAKNYHSGSTEATLIRKTLSSVMNSEISPNLDFRFKGIEDDINFKESSNKNNYYILFQKNNKPDSIISILENSLYINLEKFNIDDFLKKSKILDSVETVIIDGRGYPSADAQQIIPYFINFPDTSNWLLQPQIERPNSARKKFKRLGWQLKPKESIYSGNVIYLVDNLTRSYGESIAIYFEHMKNCTVIGKPTAGTNGNINNLYLPGGFRIIWTGMIALKHDGSQLHGIGIIPDVYVERTPEGIAAGRDEVLEKAIELASSYAKASKDKKANKESLTNSQ